MKIYMNSVENRIKFKIKIISRIFNTRNYEITWKLKKKITKDKNGENIPH